jgi:hypothetical protein
MEALNLQRLLVDGTLYTLSLSALVIGSLAYNARLWMHDYPAEIRALQPPLTRAEKRAQYVLMILLLVIMVGGPLLSNIALKAANGGTLSFLSAFLNAFILFNAFNLFDAVVLDILLAVVLKPRFMLLPGSESRMHLYRDWDVHLRNYVKGVIGGTILSLAVAAISMLI